MWYVPASPEFIHSGKLFLTESPRPGLFSGCRLAVHWGQAGPGEHASPLEALQAADEGSKSLDSPANIGLYIPIPARGNNKLLLTVTDPTGQTTGRSLQAIYQIKWILNSILKVWMRKQLSLEQKAIDKPGSIRPSFDKISGSEGGSWSPSRYLGVPCPCPLVIQTEGAYSVLHKNCPHNLHHTAQDHDCNGLHISRGPGLSLQPPVSWD